MYFNLMTQIIVSSLTQIKKTTILSLNPITRLTTTYLQPPLQAKEPRRNGWVHFLILPSVLRTSQSVEHSIVIQVFILFRCHSHHVNPHLKKIFNFELMSSGIYTYMFRSLQLKVKILIEITIEDCGEKNKVKDEELVNMSFHQLGGSLNQR